MAVCTYFLRGQCKFGSTCRNEHPQGAAQRQGGFGNTSWTNPSQNATDTRIPFTMESMGMDLTPQKDKPSWPLSCYGPAKYEPNLISGLDESQEELRFRAVTANQSGKITEYMTYEKETITSAEQTIANARNNLNQAFERAVTQSTTNLPNGPPGGASALGAPASTSAFGNTASTNAFGKSALGNTTSTSAFGTSTFGNTTSTFGKPAFGQSAFGQSTFGQTATPAPAFGQPASAFEQLGPAQGSQPSSAFGQPPSSTSAFGQPSQPSSLIKPASGAFGSSSSSTNAFSAFSGQPTAFGSGAPTTTQPASGGSVFGQSAFGATATTNQSAPSVFGNPSTTPGTSAFGGPVPSTTTTSAFGGPSAFGTLAQQQQQPVASSAFGGTSSPFGASSNSTASAFNSQAAPLGNAFNNASSSPFAPAGGGSSSSAFPGPSPMQSAISQPPLSAFPMASPTTSTGFNAVAQPQPSNATTKKGPPDFSQIKSLYKPGLTPYDQILPPDYLQRIPESALKAFQSDKLEWDNIPDWIPPLELR